MTDHWEKEHRLWDVIGSGDMSQLKRLYKNGYDVVGAKDRAWTSLHRAAGMGQLRVVKYLIETCKANVNAVDSFKETALHEAARKAQPGVVHYLVTGTTVVVDTVNQEGRTALHIACTEGDLDIVRTLIDAHASTSNADSYGYNVLHLAAGYARHSITRYLIEDVGVSTIERDKEGMTAFELAVQRKHEKVAHYLQEAMAAKAQGQLQQLKATLPPLKERAQFTVDDIELDFPQRRNVKYHPDHNILEHSFKSMSMTRERQKKSRGMAVRTKRHSSPGESKRVERSASEGHSPLPTQAPFAFMPFFPAFAAPITETKMDD